ncbi:MAG: hypothetical protein GXP08_07945 [Gammaproteobacteria bacterium]|nr:hypothetical protein [Gammaproteobacteria bacterium]
MPPKPKISITLKFNGTLDDIRSSDLDVMMHACSEAKTGCVSMVISRNGHSIRLLMFIFVLAGLTACIDTDTSDDGDDQSIPVTGVSIIDENDILLSDDQTLLIVLNDQRKLNARVFPLNADKERVRWHSADPDIARVDATGRVTAVGVIDDRNNTTITVTTVDGDFTASIVVAVKIPVESITIDGDSIRNVSVDQDNQSISLTATVMPEIASDKAIEWTSSNETIASVDAAGVITVHADAVSGEHEIIISATSTSTAEVAAQLTLNISLVVGSLVDIKPTVTVSHIKQLRFEWPAVDNATFYRLLINADGISGFTTTADNIVDPFYLLPVAVHLTDWTNATYMVEAYKGDNIKIGQSTAYRLTPSQDANQPTPLDIIGYMKPLAINANTPDGKFGDRFGGRVVLSADGNTLVVGMADEDSLATGVHNNTHEDAFAEIVKQAGRYTTVGNTHTSRGAAYVYARNSDGAWALQAYLKSTPAADQLTNREQFGKDLALSADGNTLVVGAPKSHRPVQNEGGTTWIQTTGAVYVFVRDDNGLWAEDRVLYSKSPSKVDDQFGHAVALSANGEIFAVSAIGVDGRDDNGKFVYSIGKVEIYERWELKGSLLGQSAGGFGGDMALSGDGKTLVVGAPSDDSYANNAGRAFVFVDTEAGWNLQHSITASNAASAAANSFFGWAVGVDDTGKTIAISAFKEHSDAKGVNPQKEGENNSGSNLDDDNSNATQSGAVYVFTRNAEAVTQQAYIKSPNARAYHWFGRSLALSTDGKHLATGAIVEGSNARGINGDQSNTSADRAGAAYVYTYRGESGGWQHTAYVKASNTTPLKTVNVGQNGSSGDRFGSAIALNNDGTSLAVGAYWEQSNAIGVVGYSAEDEANGVGQGNDDVLKGGGAVYLY